MELAILLARIGYNMGMKKNKVAKLRFIFCIFATGMQYEIRSE